MQHLRKNRKFGRRRHQRLALQRGLLRAVIERETITTTAAKAKSLRPVLEKIITQAKHKNLSTTRYLHSFLNSTLIKKVYETLVPRYQAKAGGYSRILKIPSRKSDGAALARIELIK